MGKMARKAGELARSLATILIVMSFAVPGLEAKNLALEPKSQAAWKQTVNQGTVRILTKGLGCTCTVIASDMANVLNKTGELRVLPVIGHGSLQGIADVMYLRGIDVSILQSDVLAYVERNSIHPNIRRKMRYITKLYNSELHLIAARHIKSIQDLDGKLVSYDVEGRGSFITAENVFQSLGIKPEPVHYERDVAIEKVKDNEIAAAFVVTGKPASSLNDLGASDGLHLLPVPINKNLEETYLPSTLTHEDYPTLVEEGESIATISVPEVLAVYDWSPDHERYAKVSTFVESLFSNFDQFSDSSVRHPKWKDVDLAAEIPGWQRFKPAQEWLDRDRQLPIEDTVQLRVGDKIIHVRSNQVEHVSELEAVEPAAVDSFVTHDSTAIAAQDPVKIEVNQATSTEGASEIAFNIMLSRSSDEQLPIAFQTLDGTAKAERDFRDQNGVLLIDPGVRKAEIKIELIDDNVKEQDEQFYVIMATNPEIAVFEQSKHSATISDDDS